MDPAEIDRKMTRFAETFPCVRKADGIEPWNSLALDRWAQGPISHAERVTARFLLAVWDPGGQWKSEPFDLMEALRIWDAAHHQAFLKWAADPWWP